MKDVEHPYVLIVEDHPLVADSLMSCVRSARPSVNLRTTDSLRGALAELAQGEHPRLILSDLSLIDSHGIETVSRLRAAAPETVLLVFTATDDVGLREQAYALGVTAFVLKSAPSEVLRAEIDSALGEIPAVAGTEKPESRYHKLESILTAKQIAVLEELAAGRSNKEIATRLNIGVQTVGSHMKEILGRLDVKNRTEAVVRYFQLINP